MLPLKIKALVNSRAVKRQSSPFIMALNCIWLNSPSGPRWRPFSVPHTPA